MTLIERARNGFRPTDLELEMANEIERIQETVLEISKRSFGHPSEKLAEIMNIIEGSK